MPAKAKLEDSTIDIQNLLKPDFAPLSSGKDIDIPDFSEYTAKWKKINSVIYSTLDVTVENLKKFQ